MRDEVLQKVLTDDSTIIPRYDIVRPDGTMVAENVQLVLKNTVLTEGTALNKQALLKDTTAILYGLNAENAVPDDVLVAIRNGTSYCPKIKIKSIPNSTIYIQNMTAGIQASYTVPMTSELIIDVPVYGIYKIRCTNVPEVYIEVTETKEYQVELYYMTPVYVKVTVDEEIGATIQATLPDGCTVTGVVGIDKTCTLALYAAGVWRLIGTYDNCNTAATTFSVSLGAAGTTTNVSLPAWTKLKVEVTTGSIVTISKSGVTKTGVSIDGVCTFWLPGADTWGITATLGGKSTGGMATLTAGATKVVALKYS